MKSLVHSSIPPTSTFFAFFFFNLQHGILQGTFKRKAPMTIGDIVIVVFQKHGYLSSHGIVG